jgi:Protein of unknown function (DUF992)
MRWPIASLMLLALSGTAFAQVPINIGVLTCTLAETGEQDTTPPSQTRDMICRFKPSGSGPEEQYAGEIRKVGTRGALSGTAVLIWVVVGPADSKLGPGHLAQSYIGTQAPNAGGTQAPVVLVGKENENFALRPLNDTSATRDETTPAAAGVTVVVLKVKSVPA